VSYRVVSADRRPIAIPPLTPDETEVRVEDKLPDAE